MVLGRILALAALGAASFTAPAAAQGALPLTVSYFGETGSHPGLLLGSEHALWRQGDHTLLATGDVGGYTHPLNHTGWMARAGLGHRLSLPGGWSTDAQLGIGYLHTFLAGDVYREVAGQLDRRADGGSPALMPVASLGLGCDASRWGLADSRLFGRLTLFGQFPSNQAVLWRPALELGVSWGIH